MSARGRSRTLLNMSSNKSVPSTTSSTTRTPPWQTWHPSHGIAFAASSPHALYPSLSSWNRFTTVTEPHDSTSAYESDVSQQPRTLLPYRTHFSADQGKGSSLPWTGQMPSSRREVDARAVTAETPLTQGSSTFAAIEAAEEGGEDEGTTDAAPFTPLDFKIPDELFRSASLAEPGSPESFWSYSMYRGPECNSQTEADLKVKVHYCKSKATTERVLQYFLHEKVIGFDLEWSPNAMKHHGARKNVSLVQLASETRIALFHLALFPAKDDLATPTLKAIMEDPSITKTGVNIKGDCTRLRNHLDIDSRGVFELSHLYRLVKHTQRNEQALINKKLVSLAQQVKDCLGLPMFKGQDVRGGEWSTSLSMDQIVYSASDAYAGVHLYHVLNYERQALVPEPPLPYHAELGLPIRLAVGPEAADVDEGLDDLDVEIKTQDKVPAQLSQEYLLKAGQSLSIEAECEDDRQTAAVSPDSRQSAASRRPVQPKDPRIIAAEAWLMAWREPRKLSRVPPSSLRAYRIWQTNADLKPADIAALLRDPPLQTMTVVSYILEAIKMARLPFDPVRLRHEVLALLPAELAASKYGSLMRMTDCVGEPLTMGVP